MTTTIMRDSTVGDQWIANTYAANPIKLVVDPTTGQPTGDISTGPVRLAFCDNVFTPSKPDEKGEGGGKYGATLLFPPMADFTLFHHKYNETAWEQYKEFWDAQQGIFHGLHSPFHDQRTKANQYGGFTPGCTFFNTSSQFKPSVCDLRFNPIVDPAKVYPGVWALCTVKPYLYSNKKKGVGFGLQGIMLIADDTKFGGGAPDVRQQFAGVNVAAPIARPDMSQMPQGGAPVNQPPANPFNQPAQHFSMNAGPGGQPGFTGQPAPGMSYANTAPAQQPTSYPPANGYAQPATTSPIDEELAALRAMGLA